jgi:hypothetical protein
MSDFNTLKQRHRSVRDGYPTNLNLRVHRALSWLQRAEIADDADSKFIFLWISFNAAYAYEIDETSRLSEQETFKFFLDTGKKIDGLIWKEFSGSIRVLLDNEFVFQGFWDFHAKKISEEDWKMRFAKGKHAAQTALASGNSPQLLGVVFNRLYTLRNQLIHGGATWNGSVNRKQLSDCVQLLGKLVPVIIELMIENPNTLWGDACYPVIGSD